MTNYIAILVAGIISMVIGAFWYSPKVFGTSWAKLAGLTEESMQKAKEKGMGKLYLTNFITVLVTASVFSYFIKMLSITDLSGSTKAAFLIWLGFGAAKGVGSIIWEQRPIKLFFINTLHDLISLVVMGGVLTLMQ